MRGDMGKRSAAIVSRSSAAIAAQSQGRSGCLSDCGKIGYSGQRRSGDPEMLLKGVARGVLAGSIALLGSACVPPPPLPPGPGCLIHLYTLPGLQGYGMPVRRDTEELAPAWHDQVSSAKVIYGTWRLFADRGFKGFMGDYKAPVDVPYLIPPRQLDSLQCIASEPPPPPPPRY